MRPHHAPDCLSEDELPACAVRNCRLGSGHHQAWTAGIPYSSAQQTSSLDSGGTIMSFSLSGAESLLPDQKTSRDRLRYGDCPPRCRRSRQHRACCPAHALRRVSRSPAASYRGRSQTLDSVRRTLPRSPQCVSGFIHANSPQPTAQCPCCPLLRGSACRCTQ